eukprot:TRINITY_DN2013_c0_g1_i1.p1 TRINITY_DN2013_c0_g1~~TRINITY_DN2013_c0_g1_i1.p1  ORF type:complete len:308 (-),score=55.05 TRINITY_DN2013_c0_g1_i1:316-1239(-)
MELRGLCRLYWTHPIHLLLFILLFLHQNDEARAVLLKDVGVPTYAVNGKDATLVCDYDLEGQALYSVKWYKNGLEIFRYLPSNPVPVTTYARPGVKVDVSRSDDTRITLRNLNMKSTGRYRCEVSTEAPTFATVSGYGDMIVVVTPSNGPKIHGGKVRYRPGDTVNVNCTSRKSKPAADLLWSINGEPALDSMLVKYPIHNTTRGLHTSTLGLRFEVLPEHFHRGDMKLKCTATIATIYWKSNERSAEGLKRKRNSAPFYSEEYNQGPDFFSHLSGQTRVLNPNWLLPSTLLPIIHHCLIMGSLYIF